LNKNIGVKGITYFEGILAHFFSSTNTTKKKTQPLRPGWNMHQKVQSSFQLKFQQKIKESYHEGETKKVGR
jgi:hypothetical protein